MRFGRSRQVGFDSCDRTPRFVLTTTTTTLLLSLLWCWDAIIGTIEARAALRYPEPFIVGRARGSNKYWQRPSISLNVITPSSLDLIIRGGGTGNNEQHEEDDPLAGRNARGREQPENPDLRDQQDQDDSYKSETPTTEIASSEEEQAHVAATGVDEDSSAASAGLGIKSHHKKSNAVGDPDGDGSDSDDSDIDTEEWEELAEELKQQNIITPSQQQEQQQLHVELEVVDDDHNSNQPNTADGRDLRSVAAASEEPNQVRDVTVGGGGVGLRMGQRLNRRKTNNNNRTKDVVEQQPLLVNDQLLLEAWSPYVFLPPSPAALAFLKRSARAINGASKIRLDRRTMYAGLLLEWHNANETHRKFLDKSTSQTLQAALSLATQPHWRRSLSMSNGIRLYDEDPDRGCTLAMQETIALALAHSLRAGMVLIDDNVLSSVRQKLLKAGAAEESVKPAALIQSVLTFARQGRLRQISAGGSISSYMHHDLHMGLDDPFDERATTSCEDMAEWEKQWKQVDPSQEDTTGTDQDSELPLVILVRTHASGSLLKSKSVVETLLQECDSKESTNLLVLARGIDGRTMSLPTEPVPESSDSHDLSGRNTPGGGAGGGAVPWFGFSPHNQNASGQNDPEGSRRFNIFLARTVDQNGTPGILGAIAPPQAGNLFPHLLAMQARERLQQQDVDLPIRAELERWAQMLQEQMQTSGGGPLPAPQFFNATLTATPSSADNGQDSSLQQHKLQPPPSPEVIQQTLQQAMSELLDRLAQMSDGAGDEPTASELSPDLHKAFAQVLRNEHLRRGIAENLARAVPALSDPKCQGVMLSVYVPPPPSQMNRGKSSSSSRPSGRAQTGSMGSWFQKILNSQEEPESDEADDIASKRNSRQRRARTLAAAAAVLAAKSAEAENDTEKQENNNKAERNLARLESACRPIVLRTPSDPVRAKSWEKWISRERGAVIFRQNRRVLREKLAAHSLSLQEHTGTRGAGSALRQMLSVRDISDEMGDVIKCAIELEAAKSQREGESPHNVREKELMLDVDITLSQLLLTDDGLVENTEKVVTGAVNARTDFQLLHPSTLEAALSIVCKINPSPSGGMALSGTPASHRTREEIAALAQDKHERALISQVVSPQDIGVTYDMIGGLSDVKELLRESITYPLRFPHLYSEGIAREAVKGVLLFGPPGTGKTMLAKAVATEGGASFLSVDASSVENKWLGESEKNAKAVFTLARRLAPCVIFIDEVDSLLSSREGASDDSAHGTLTSVKTTMMSEWDGLNSGTNGLGEAGSDRVIVIGSTNRPFDLDEAVLRRFPRRILVDLPDLETRKEILEVTLAENRLDPSVNLTKIAERLDGYTGSDIKEVCREAVVQISHEQARRLDQGMSANGGREDVTQGSLQRLRPVTVEDFDKALRKLKRSVSEKGRELAQVWEWNEEYGEIKREKKNQLPQLASMYL